MTFDEAKKIFLNRGYIEVDGGSYFDGNKWRDSVCVISEWLKEEPCTSEDAISRQAVLDAFWKLDIELSPNTIDTILNMINDISPVIPRRKTGRWEWVRYDSNPNIGNWHCSECMCVVVECVDKK